MDIASSFGGLLPSNTYRGMHLAVVDELQWVTEGVAEDGGERRSLLWWWAWRHDVRPLVHRYRGVAKALATGEREEEENHGKRVVDEDESEDKEELAARRMEFAMEVVVCGCLQGVFG